MIRVFVYGTLKRGGSNQVKWLEGQTFVQTARTRDRYRMFNKGSYPVVIPSLDGYEIEGEIWEVDEAGLARLDELEGVEEGLYIREKVRLQNDPESAWMYLYPGSVDDMEECGPEWDISIPGEG